MEHLFVRLLVIERYYWDAVVDLICEGVHTIINNNHVFHPAIRNYAKILHIIAFRSLDTVLSVQSVLEQFILRINVVEDSICVSLM